MASLEEKLGVLKGMAKMVNFDADSKEGKLLSAVLDLLDDLTKTLIDLEDYTAELTEQVDAIDEDLDLLESDYYEDWEEDEDYDEADDEFYDVTCPSCDTTFCVDEETLLEGGIDCPNCGEKLEFEIDEDDEEEEEEEK